jgi:MFS transporter, DHA1 family, multidrug resistance protein
VRPRRSTSYCWGLSACALAPDIGTLIAFRFLQGMAGAAGIVLSLAMVRDMYDGPDLARIWF